MEHTRYAGRLKFSSDPRKVEDETPYIVLIDSSTVKTSNPRSGRFFCFGLQHLKAK